VNVIWLIVALVTWPALALAVGLLLGRGIAASEQRAPRLGPATWLRRDVPRDIVAPLPQEREATHA
jgi:hypothetical protein